MGALHNWPRFMPKKNFRRMGAVCGGNVAFRFASLGLQCVPCETVSCLRTLLGTNFCILRLGVLVMVGTLDIRVFNRSEMFSQRTLHGKSLPDFRIIPYNENHDTSWTNKLQKEFWRN
jgi:hypothetical protein